MRRSRAQALQAEWFNAPAHARVARNQDALRQAEASEAAFKSEPLSKFKVIHLAVHGVASPRYPDRAALVWRRAVLWIVASFFRLQFEQ